MDAAKQVFNKLKDCPDFINAIADRIMPKLSGSFNVNDDHLGTYEEEPLLPTPFQKKENNNQNVLNDDNEEPLLPWR